MTGTHSGEFEELPPARCPPSVPQYLWDAVPEDLKWKFIEAAAIEFRRGIHPANTFEELLEERGIRVVVPATPPKRPSIPSVKPTKVPVPVPVTPDAGLSDKIEAAELAQLMEDSDEESFDNADEWSYMMDDFD